MRRNLSNSQTFFTMGDPAAEEDAHRDKSNTSLSTDPTSQVSGRNRDMLSVVGTHMLDLAQCVSGVIATRRSSQQARWHIFAANAEDAEFFTDDRVHADLIHWSLVLTSIVVLPVCPLQPVVPLQGSQAQVQAVSQP